MKRHTILPALFVTLLLCGCAGSKQSMPERGTITGRIFVIGNEPFTKLAVETPEGIMYPLKCDKKTEQELRKKQGHKVRIDYNGIEQAPDGYLLKVHKVEIPAE